MREREIEQVVVGLPLTMRGEEGDQARWTRRFAERLAERVDVPVAMHDERLTTRQAERSGGAARGRLARRGPSARGISDDPYRMSRQDDTHRTAEERERARLEREARRAAKRGEPPPPMPPPAPPPPAAATARPPPPPPPPRAHRRRGAAAAAPAATAAEPTSHRATSDERPATSDQRRRDAPPHRGRRAALVLVLFAGVVPVLALPAVQGRRRGPRPRRDPDRRERDADRRHPRGERRDRQRVLLPHPGHARRQPRRPEAGPLPRSRTT